MQTYTHFVIVQFANRKIKALQAESAQERPTDAPQTLPPMETWPALLGSIAPDAPLTLTFLLFFAMDRMASDSDATRAEQSRTQSRVSHLFGTLFFKDWRMKLGHNLFHAPILTILYTFLGYWGWTRNTWWGKRWGSSLFWFGASCTLHTAIDIPLHYDDGPLIFFPFDWQTRVYSPVSYWDSKRHGHQFTVFEHLLLIVLGAWLLRDWWRTKANSRTSPTVDEAVDKDDTQQPQHPRSAQQGSE